MESLKLNIPSKNIIKSVLELINPYIGNLTSQELALLDVMISNKLTTINSDVRAKIRTLSNLEKYTFNNYIKKLKDKNILLLNNNVMFVNPKIIEMTKSKSVNVTFHD